MIFTLLTFLFWLITICVSTLDSAPPEGEGVRLYAAIYRSTKAEQWSREEQIQTGLAISPDRGHTWKAIGWPNTPVYDFLLLQGETDTFFLACGSGIIRSTDSGSTWKLVSPWYVRDARRLLWTDSGRVFLCGTAHGMYLHDRTENSWIDASGGLRTPGERFINAIHGTGTGLLAATEGGIVRSTDGGRTWIHTALTGKEVRAFSFHANSGRIAFAATASDGMFISEDGGTTFQQRNTGLMNLRMLTAAFDPSDDRVLYCSSPGYGVFQSTDRGRTWNIRSRGLTNYNVTAILVDPDAAAILYAGTKGGLFRSVDRGGRWDSYSLPWAHVNTLRFE